MASPADAIQDLNDLTIYSRDEVEAFSIFSRKYRSLNPEPQKPRTTRQGWEFYAYLIVSTAAVLLASMRTAEQFYRAATFSSNEVLGFVEAFLAVFTVEVGIVVYAAVLASRRQKISQWTIVLGVILLAAISIVAGFGQSLHLATDADPLVVRYTEYALSILIGPGASIAALIGGHILGTQIAIAARDYEKQMEVYHQAVEEYEKKLRRSWLRSLERKVARRMALNHMGEEDKEELALEAVPVPERMETQSLSEDVFKTSRKTITQWFLRNRKTPYDLDINPAEIAKDTGLPSEHVKDVIFTIQKNGSGR